jgi:hypothetical protein
MRKCEQIPVGDDGQRVQEVSISSFAADMHRALKFSGMKLSNAFARQTRFL